VGRKFQVAVAAFLVAALLCGCNTTISDKAQSDKAAALEKVAKSTPDGDKVEK